MDWLTGGIGSALGGLASGLFGYKGTKDQNIASATQAQKQMDFQERMSNTAHQRQIADMRAAGLNPILSAKYGGASSPAGQQAPMHNKAQVALQNANTAANIQNIIANTNKTKEETRKIAAKADIGDVGSNIIDYVLDKTEKGMSNTRDIAESYFRRDNWFNPDNYQSLFDVLNIPRPEKHPAAIKADRKYAKQKTRRIISKHPRTRRRGR